MKKLMELMAEELASAFEKAGYNPEYGKVTVSNRPNFSATVLWQEPKHTRKHHL